MEKAAFPSRRKFAPRCFTSICLSSLAVLLFSTHAESLSDIHVKTTHLEERFKSQRFFDIINNYKLDDNQMFYMPPDQYAISTHNLETKKVYHFFREDITKPIVSNEDSDL